MSKELWLYFCLPWRCHSTSRNGCIFNGSGVSRSPQLHSWVVVVGTFCVPPRLSTACSPLLVGVGFFRAVKLIPFVRLVLVTARNRRITLILNMMKFWCYMAATVRTVAMCIAYARWWIAPVTPVLVTSLINSIIKDKYKNILQWRETGARWQNHIISEVIL